MGAVGLLARLWAGQGGIIGGLEWFGLNGVGTEPNPDYAATIPHQAFMLFQMMFAVITPALITGAYAERMKFSSVYLVHAAVGDFHLRSARALGVGSRGWVRNLGALDFAGGTVVHISSGHSGAGFRHHGEESDWDMARSICPAQFAHDPYGCVLALVWMVWVQRRQRVGLPEHWRRAPLPPPIRRRRPRRWPGWSRSGSIEGKPSALGAASGAVAGLVAITPASGFVGPISAIWIGIGAGVLCYTAVMLKPLFGYDDALDAVGVHGVGGSWGALATGLFASKAVNSAGADGLFFGNPAQLGIQAMAVLVTIVFVFIGTSNHSGDSRCNNGSACE